MQEKTMTSKNEIAGQRLFEDDSFVVLSSKGPFALSLPLLTNVYVYIKPRQEAIKASAKEKGFLFAVIAEWAQMGLAPKLLRETQVFHDFAVAVSARGGAHWTLFFKSCPPRQLAESLRTQL